MVGKEVYTRNKLAWCLKTEHIDLNWVDKLNQLRMELN